MIISKCKECPEGFIIVGQGVGKSGTMYCIHGVDHLNILELMEKL